MSRSRILEYQCVNQSSGSASWTHTSPGDWVAGRKQGGNCHAERPWQAGEVEPQEPLNSSPNVPLALG